MKSNLLSLIVAALLALPLTVRAQAPATRPAKPIIEVCFVLDTTGSMSGLIEGAKLKIWSIANDIIRTEPRPQVYIGLVGYRDRGDEYVTRVLDLTDDIDLVFKNLQTFSADGGGDGPESVNQAMSEAVGKLKWNPGPNVTKIIFLVGDAPPHMDYGDDVKYQQVCQDAVKKNLIINTVQCGSQSDTRPFWQEIARLGEGSYVALEQGGGMVAIATPFDEEMAKLNGAMNGTIVAYGRSSQQAEVAAKVAASARPAAEGAFGGAATASRLAYNAADGKAVQGRGDLVKDARDGLVKFEDLKPEELPEEIRGMTPEQQKAYLDKKAAERAEVQKKIDELAKKRQDFIDAERKRLEAASGKDSFDAKVAEIVKEQAARRK